MLSRQFRKEQENDLYEFISKPKTSTITLFNFVINCVKYDNDYYITVKDLRIIIIFLMFLDGKELLKENFRKFELGFNSFLRSNSIFKNSVIFEKDSDIIRKLKQLNVVKCIKSQRLFKHQDIDFVLLFLNTRDKLSEFFIDINLNKEKKETSKYTESEDIITVFISEELYIKKIPRSVFENITYFKCECGCIFTEKYKLKKHILNKELLYF